MGLLVPISAKERPTPVLHAKLRVDGCAPGKGFHTESLQFPKASAIEFFTPVSPEAASLGIAVVLSSNTPLLLLSEDLTVKAASGSFCRCFDLEPASVAGSKLYDLGAGEWNVPQLRSLLQATGSGKAAIDAYEMDLVRNGREKRRLVLNAHKLDYLGDHDALMILGVADVTEARLAAKAKDDLVREKQILLEELQHRVANSLQIIASVLMQSARQVQSEETRAHLQDAHHRVMSIASLQKQLAATSLSKVALGPYFKDLCDTIRASMIPDPDLLKLTVDVEGSDVSTDSSVSLGLIVTELVINSLKHAFPGPDEKKGKIAIGYRSHGSGWTLTVADDGIGTDVATAKPGLGTGIVEALAKQLEAVVSIRSAHPGTLVSIIKSAQ
jgi:two-component system, sensor histidine kinase PdtaS